MLICRVYKEEDHEGGRYKLIIQPEITNGDEEMEIFLSVTDAEAIQKLQKLSDSREYY